jgi:hypothetical protein
MEKAFRARDAQVKANVARHRIELKTCVDPDRKHILEMIIESYDARNTQRINGPFTRIFWMIKELLGMNRRQATVSPTGSGTA